MGWAIDTSGESWPTDVHIYDGYAGNGRFLSVGFGRIVQRPDVAQHFGNPAYITSGFQAEFDLRHLSHGTHTITVYVRFGLRGWWSLSFPFTVFSPPTATPVPVPTPVPTATPPDAGTCAAIRQLVADGLSFGRTPPEVITRLWVTTPGFKAASLPTREHGSPSARSC